MAHPNKKDASESQNAKMRKMTEHYGSAAGPEENIPAETNRLKSEGEEDSVGFGADASAPRARADRASRKPRTTAANPVSTYRKGGRVKRADGGDVSSIEEANRNQAMATPGRARGGRMKHKGATHVNVIVAPQGASPGGPMGAGATPPPVLPVGGPPGLPPGLGAGPPPAMPPHPPMGMPPGGPMAGGPMAPMPPGMPPPGMMPPRAKGGRVYHADEAEDKALFKKMFKESEKKEGKTERARGGKVTSIHDMDAGSMSGEGRLQKAELQKHSGKIKSQVV